MSRQSDVYQFRISPREKEETFKILAELGLTPAQAIKLFLKQVKKTRSIPFDISIPNEETEKVIEEIQRGENLIHCKDKDDLFKKLGI